MSGDDSVVENLFRAAHEDYLAEVAIPALQNSETEEFARQPDQAVAERGFRLRWGVFTGAAGFFCVLVLVLSLFQTASVSAQLETMESRLAEVIKKRSSAILTDSRMLSADLAKRRYLLDQFGGGASSRYEPIGGLEAGQGHLRIVVRRHEGIEDLGMQPQAFAGLILFGNHNVTGGFSPIDLSAVSRVSFKFRYPEVSSEGVFYLRLKNLDNYETLRIPIETDEPRGEWQTFELLPQDDERTSAMTSGRIASSIKAMTIYTDDFDNWEGDPTIEVKDFQITSR